MPNGKVESVPFLTFDIHYLAGHSSALLKQNNKAQKWGASGHALSHSRLLLEAPALPTSTRLTSRQGPQPFGSQR